MLNRSYSVHTSNFSTFLNLRHLQFSSYIAILLAFIVGLSGAARAAELTGATSGELGVSPAGAASYSIPISVPPGTTGMQPSLTLQYSSQAGNGIMGVGWSIGGLSSITRCGTDIHNDQTIDPVDFETDDKFCMNGERLVPIVGTNGADGTEYRTQQEEFSKIVSYGNAGTGPLWFKVWKKNGQVYQYGAGGGTTVEASGRSEARAWMLHKITDQRGNYIEFVYTEDIVLGRLSLAQVNYTGNTAQGLAPYNSVVFDYEARPDTSKAYLAGSVIEQHERLQKVRVLAGTTQVRDYTVAYEISGTGRSRPISVTECGVGSTDCFAPTVFEWSPDGAGKFSLFSLGANEGLTSSSYDEKRVIGSGDFNNDGLTDFYITRVNSNAQRKKHGSNKDQIWLSDGDGTFTKIWREYADGLRNDDGIIATGDFDGDGNVDLYISDIHGGGRLDNTQNDSMLFGDGAGNFNKVLIGVIDSTVDYWGIGAVGDFNGDGLTDLYLYQQDNKGRAYKVEIEDEFGEEIEVVAPNQVWLANRIGNNNITFTKQEVDSANSVQDGHSVVATGDFNGDGLIDLYTVLTDDHKRGKQTGADSVHLSDGAGGFVRQAVSDVERVPDDFSVMSTGDFNGDSLTDLYLTKTDNYGRGVSGGADKVLIGRGDGTFENINVPGANRIPDNYKVVSGGDFNGDGLTDFYVTETDGKGRLNSNSHNNDSIFLSDGKGGFTKELLPAGAGGAVTSGWDDYVVAATGDFNGDGLADLYYWKGDDNQRSKSGSYYDHVVFSAWNPTDYLTKVTNGLGLWSEFQYKTMTDTAVYTAATDATYPVNDILTAGQLVHKVVADNGIGGSNTQTYKYEGFKVHIAGVGGLGFRAMEVTDDSTGIVTESTYLQAWQTHHQGMLERSRTIAPGDIVLKDQQVTWAVSFRPGGGTDGVAQCFRYADTSTTTSRDLNGVLMSTVTETTTYDDYGYPTTLVASTAGSGKTFTKTTNNVYTHNAATWILGRLSSASVIHAATGQTNITRTSSFTYEATGEIATETVASTSGLTVTKTNAYNAFGAVTSVTETWGEPVGDGIVATSRTTSYTYDAKVRHQLTETNPLGHSETRTFDPDTGLIASLTGPNNLTTSWIHDAFGRVTRETRADGTYTDTIREACGPTTFACGTDLALRTITRPQGGAESTVVADRLLRTRLSYALVNGQLSYINEEYDAQGRMIQKSEPYFSGNTVHWTTIQYDLLGRPIITTRPDNSTQLVTYNGLTQVATNEIGQTKTVTKDAIGQTVSVTDNASNVTTHVYDAIGQMTSMSGPLGNTSTYVYDDRGNKVSDTDPDKGTWTYRYNALGMLVEQTDAKGQVTRMTYDVLGRMLTRIDDADSAGAAARTATWTYDTGNKAIGKLVASTSGNGYASTADYDSFGRPSQATETIDGTAYTTTTTYDSFSRADSVIYPSGLRTQNVYDANGLLTEVKNYTSQASYWQLLEMDARGNVSKERLGNGVETTRTYESETGQLNAIFSVKDLTTVQDLSYTLDDLGNLTQRRDTVQNLTEDFLYDNLNRVTSIATTYGNGQATNATVTMTYDAIGNITSKTGVGTYTYGQVHGSCAASQQYAGPNAVTQVAGTKNATYCYDANGNQTAGDGRTITYSAFDKPTQILKGANIVNVWYGPDRSRFKREDQTTSGTTTTVYAMGGSYESIQQPSLVVEEKHYIAGVAVVSTYSNSQIAATRYLLKDNLGSLDTITDEVGAIVQKMSFDAWGKRREVDWTALSGTALLAFDTSITTRGYTGHEMLDPVGLVHMNGRVYDAEIGRFLSADPNIQDVENFQNWNRYTYVLNNPLSYTDPSGFFFSKIFKAIGNFFKSVFKAIGSVFKALLKIPLIRSAIQIVACGVGPITCTLAAGALTLLSGGSILEAVTAMAFSFAQVGDWGIWSHVGTYVEQFKELGTVGFAAVKGAIHGVVGGAISVAQGGNFQEGFAANAIGAAVGVFSQGVFGKAGTGGLAGKIARTASAAVAGGAAAIVAGGKFASGALTAAFAHLYNQELTAASSGARAAAVAGGRMAAAAATAGVLVGIDGPAPFGDFLAGLYLGYTALSGLWQDDLITVYRVYGGISGPLGRSWSPIDPRSIPNYREAAGLPALNTGRFLSVGQVVSFKDIMVRPAQPLHGNHGGLPEFVVLPPSSVTQRIRILHQGIKLDPPL